MMIKPYQPFIGIIAGHPGCGKTYGVMSFPSPMLIIDMENRATWNLLFYPDKDITIKKGVVYNDRGLVDPIGTIRNFENIVIQTIREMKQGKWKTVAVDGISDLRDWVAKEQVAKGVKLWSPEAGPVGWGKVNERVRNLLFPLMNASRELATEGKFVNIVFTAWLKKVYDDQGRVKGYDIDAKEFINYNVDWLILARVKEVNIVEEKVIDGVKKQVRRLENRFLMTCKPPFGKGRFIGWELDVTDTGFWGPFKALCDKWVENLLARRRKVMKSEEKTGTAKARGTLG